MSSCQDGAGPGGPGWKEERRKGGKEERRKGEKEKRRKRIGSCNRRASRVAKPHLPIHAPSSMLLAIFRVLKWRNWFIWIFIWESKLIILWKNQPDLKVDWVRQPCDDDGPTRFPTERFPISKLDWITLEPIDAINRIRFGNRCLGIKVAEPHASPPSSSIFKFASNMRVKNYYFRHWTGRTKLELNRINSRRKIVIKTQEFQ